MWFIFHREQSHSYGKRAPQTYFTNVWQNQSDRGGCKFFFLLLLSLRGFESLSKYVHR